MEGDLWKWTNYWNGWQPRWFVLSENGVLSYYYSHQDVDQGCKGSMNLGACEIVVSQNDNTRLDIVVSHEKYLYLRAKNDKERQKWLVALGSAKASVSKTNTHGRSRLSSASPIPVPATSCAQAPCSLQLSSKENDDEERELSKRKTSYDLLKAKRSELRLYCDLLMQQAHTIRTSVNQDFPNQTTRVDIQKLDEGCSLLTQTCDTFISTLDETLKLSLATNLTSSHNGDTKNNLNSPQYGIPSTSVNHNQDKNKLGRGNSFDGSSRLTSVTEHYHEKYPQYEQKCPSQRQHHGGESHSNDSFTYKDSLSENPSNTNEHQGQNNSGFMDVFGSSNPVQENSQFHSMPPVGSLGVEENGKSNTPSSYSQLTEQNEMELTLKPLFPHSSTPTGVDTRQFILASTGAVKIFDYLGPTTFAPIRSEITAHTARIKTKFESNPMEFATLNDILDIEINNGIADQNGSASGSLLWLVRNLMFIHDFLRRFAESDINSDSLIKDCLGAAYESCLRKYHTPVIHNVFSIALEGSPDPRIFLDSLGRINTYNTHNTSVTKEISWTNRNDWRELFQINLLPSLGEYLDTMEKCLVVLINFYETTDLFEKTK